MEQQEREDLLAAVRDYYRRKSRRDWKTAGAAVAGTMAGYAAEDPTVGLGVAEKILTPGSGPKGRQLSDKERLDLKARLLEARNEAVRNRRAGDINEIQALMKQGASEDLLLKYTIQLATGVAQTDAQVKSARISAMASMGNKVQDVLADAVAREFETKGPAGQAQFNNAMKDIDEAFASVSFSPVEPGGTSAGAVTLGPDAVARMMAAFNATPGMAAKSGLAGVVMARAIAAKGSPDELVRALEKYPEAAPLVRQLTGESGIEAMNLVNAAASRVEGYAERVAQQLSGSAGMTPEKVGEFAEVVKGLLDTKDPDASTQKANSILDRWGGPGKLDPESQKAFADALDELDPESETYNPTLEMVRKDLFQRPDFQEYMRQTGITDPMMAMRQLKKEARNAHRSSVQQSRKAIETRNQAMREGGADPTLTGTPAVAGRGPGQARPGNIQGAAMATDPQSLTPGQRRNMELNTYMPAWGAASRAIAPTAKALKDRLRKKKVDDAQKDALGNG